MKNSKLIAILGILVLSIVFYSVAYSASSMTGKVVVISEMVKSNDGTVDKETAIKYFKGNQPMGFLTGGKLYFVVNSSGMYAGKELARVANGGEVTITGDAKSANGLNYIIIK